MEINYKHDRKYGIVMFDPPWSYDNETSNIKGKARDHYKTMKLKDLKNLDFEHFFNERCIMFMWTTSSMMDKAIELGKHWDFKYVTEFLIWIKCDKNGELARRTMGYYTRIHSENLLMFSKGSVFPFKRLKSEWISNVLMSKRGKHSEKPKEVHDIINKIFEDVPKLEVFARDKCDKSWDYYGKEVGIHKNEKFKDEELKRIRKKQDSLLEQLNKSTIKFTKKIIDYQYRFGLERGRQESICNFFKKEKVEKEVKKKEEEEKYKSIHELEEKDEEKLKNIQIKNNNKKKEENNKETNKRKRKSKSKKQKKQKKE